MSRGLGFAEVLVAGWGVVDGVGVSATAGEDGTGVGAGGRSVGGFVGGGRAVGWRSGGRSALVLKANQGQKCCDCACARLCLGRKLTYLGS